MVAVLFSSGPPILPAWGGTEALLSTSPIAAGFPLQPRPAVIDLALSTVARGKIAAYAARGEALPEGWALDAQGKPTTDATAALTGLLSPLGGAKGFALAYMVESLTAGLVGPSLSRDMPDFFDPDSHGLPQSIAHFLVMIDPAQTDAGADPAGAARRIAQLARSTADAGGRAPGSRRAALSEITPDTLIDIDDALWSRFDA
jgi:(2R)-3-sulfolactate dehydrogenase (NADP+)